MSAPRQSLAVVAHDAGGARALLPVALEMQRRGWKLAQFLAGPAATIFAEAFPASTVSDSSTQEFVTTEFKRQHVKVVLSACGLYNQIEHTVRLAALRLGLPVVAVQDAWFNHRERFEREGVASRPDLVCAMDELSIGEMALAGFTPSQLVLTGHPGLEQSVRLCKAATLKEVRGLRRAFKLKAQSLVFVFFSDPFFTGHDGTFYCGPGAIMRPDGTGLYGYTVRDVLPSVLRELEAALEKEGETADFLVRPHPAECAEVVDQIISQHPARSLRARVEMRGTTVESIQMADAVLGMMTIALLQAALAGKPAVSVELGLSASGQRDPCMANTLGYTHAAFDGDALRDLCRKLAQREWRALAPRPNPALPLEGATHRVSDCLLRASGLV